MRLSESFEVQFCFAVSSNRKEKEDIQACLDSGLGWNLRKKIIRKDRFWVGRATQNFDFKAQLSLPRREKTREATPNSSVPRNGQQIDQTVEE